MSFSSSKAGRSVAAPAGQALYEGNLSSNVNTTWVCPAGVTSVCVVAIGAGGFANNGNSAAGGGLGWKNNIPVVPGQSYAVQVGRSGFPSYFISSGTVAGNSPSTNTAGGTFVGDGGGNGGASGGGLSSGGGGAGGYAGNGTAGASTDTVYSEAATGGAASGGSCGTFYPWNGEVAQFNSGAGGGGVGVFGQGTSGASSGATSVGGKGGSGGLNGGSGGGPSVGGFGGKYGGGGGSGYHENILGETSTEPSGDAGIGAVRIIWGPNRAFPSTNTGDM